jgi:T5orf172 domain
MNKTTAIQRAQTNLNRWYSKQYKPFSTWTTYFIQGEKTGLIKIGKSRDLPQRFKDLQAASPDILVVLKSHKGDVERTLHKAFASLRLHGEWFTPGQELLDFIRDISI